MFRQMMLAAAATLILTGAAYADPIEGNWTTESGATAHIAAAGGGFTITLRSGEHTGEQIGAMEAQGDSRYAGKITDPANDKTYSGKARLAGDTLTMSGCVLGGLICQNQTWSRQ